MSLVHIGKDSLAKGSTGQTTVGTTAVQVVSVSGLDLQSGAIVKSNSDNTGVIYVGFNSQVTTSTGFPLAIGDSVPLSIDDLSKVWVISDTSSQTVSWLSQ